MKIAYYNIGCKLNFAEISTIKKKLEERGHRTVAFGTDEDAVIINTCTVTNKADADSRKVIRKALRNNPNAFIGVIGCYAQLKPDDIASIPGVDAIFGMKEKFDVIDFIDNHHQKGEPSIFISHDEKLPFHTACSEDNEDRTRMILKLQDGCDYSCTFCTIPKARGKSRSMPFDKLKEFILDLYKSKKYEIVLSGVNLGEYSAPTGENFTDVVKFIDSCQMKQRVRISSIEPNMLKPEIVETMKSSRIFCPHFHIPLQSGSDTILKKMRRRYNVELFTKLIYRIKNSMPHACIGIDVIVGFPGESDDYFNETYDLLDSLPISYLHVFTYSEREGTIATQMENPVPHDIRKQRTLALRKLSDRKKTEFYRSQLGTKQTVIPETFNKTTKTWTGWTDNYVRVFFSAPQTLESRPYQVRLLELNGEIVLAQIIEDSVSS